jgi:hypothetical protein
MTMTTYAFRITCRLAGGYFQTNQRETSLTLPAIPRIDLYLPETPKPADSFALRCGGFSSELAAREMGLPVKTAVMLAGLLLRAGIDVGTDHVVSHAARRGDGEPDLRLEPDVHGLQIVPDIEGLRFGFLRIGKRERPFSPEEFQEKVRECYPVAGRIPKQHELAAQLYAQSHFQSSSAARLIIGLPGRRIRHFI